MSKDDLEVDWERQENKERRGERKKREVEA